MGSQHPADWTWGWSAPSPHTVGLTEADVEHGRNKSDHQLSEDKQSLLRPSTAKIKPRTDKQAEDGGGEIFPAPIVILISVKKRHLFSSVSKSASI